LKANPCPFCGIKNDFSEIFNIKGSDEFHVICTNCSSAGPYGETEQEAIKLWNKRIKNI